MGEDTSQIQLFGAVAIVVDGVNVGHTDENGVKTTIPQNVITAKTGKFGQTPVKGWLNGREITVEFVLDQTDMIALAKVLPGAKRVSEAGKEKLTFGQISGKEIPAVTMTLKSFITAQTPTYDLTFPRVIPVGDFEIVNSGEDFNKWTCKFMVLANEAGGSDGDFEFSFGDDSATADVTSPFVSGVVPTDGASGIAVGDSVVATLSEDMNGNLVNLKNVKLIKDLGGSEVEVVGVVTLVNAGASTTITFNPTGDLDASTTYTFMLQNLEDQNGLALPFFDSDFTTAP